MAHDDTSSQVLEVLRTSIAEAEVHDDPAGGSDALADGQIRLRIDHFAVTANNISYATAGDLLGYWDFFPSPGAPEWGRVPAVGYAEIVESRHPDLAVGGRYHGWFPMAETVRFTATPRRHGFRDDGDHRQAHAPIYRTYTRTDLDPLHDESPDGEMRHSILRVLFLTGFLADEFFADCGGTETEAASFFGAEQVIVLSASSKTAIGFAQRAAQRDGLRVVGSTSPGNADFVRGLGYYDDVVAYDDIESIDLLDSVLIDMAGNPSVLAAVHAHLGDRLQHSMMIGKSHHDAAPSASLGGRLPGPAPAFFFAPTEVERRVAGWGVDEYQRRTVEAMQDFIEGSRSWMRIEQRPGPDGPASAWASILCGEVPPDVGLVASFRR